MRTVVRGLLCPLGGGARSLHSVADVLAIAERSFADELAVARVDGIAVSAVGPRLFAADVLLDGAIDGNRRWGGFVRIGDWSGCRGELHLFPLAVVQPFGHQVFVHAFSAAFATVAGLAVAAEAAGGVEHVGAVHPADARFNLRGYVERHIDVLAKDR